MASEKGADVKSAETKGKKLSIWEMIAWGSGSIPMQFGQDATNRQSQTILNMLLGINPVFISTMRFINQIVDMITDPITGFISDNLKTRWGRRKPLIVIGGILLMFVMIFFYRFNPEWEHSKIMIWFLGAFILYNLGTTIYGTGHFALGVELSPDYNVRTKINVVSGIMRNITGYAVPWILWFISLDIWKSGKFGPAEFGMLHGIRIYMIIGSAMFLLGVLPLVFCKERYKKIAAEENEKKKINIMEAFLFTFKNKNFWFHTMTGLFMGAGLFIFDQFNNYVNIYYVFKGNFNAAGKIIGIGGTIGQTMAIIGGVLVWNITHRIGKHNVVRLALVMMGVGAGLKWILYTPENPYLQLVIPFFYSLGISAYYNVINSMLPDIVDSDELRSGLRRESFYSGIANLIQKSAWSLAILALGFLINWSGFDAKLGGDQTPEAIFRMRILFSAMPALTCVLCFIAMSFYDLTPKKMAEIREELEKRRGQVEE